MDTTTRLLPVLRHWWRLIAVAVVIAVGLAMVRVSGGNATYEAEARLLVGPVNTDADTIKAASQLSETYAELATSDLVLGTAIRELGADTTPGRIRSKITVTADDVTRVITLHVRDADAEAAAGMAQALSDAVIETASTGTQRPEGELLLIDVPAVPSEPIRPQQVLTVVLAAAAAAFAAAAAALGLDRLIGAVKSDDDLRHIDGDLGILGSARNLRRAGALARLHLRRNPSLTPEYRLLAGKLAAQLPQDRTGIMMVTAVDDRDDADELSEGLASALREAGRSVTVVDAETFAAGRARASERPVGGGVAGAAMGVEVPRTAIEVAAGGVEPSAPASSGSVAPGLSTPPPGGRPVNTSVPVGLPVAPVRVTENGGRGEPGGARFPSSNSEGEVILVRTPPPRETTVSGVVARSASSAVAAVRSGRSRAVHVEETATLLRLAGVSKVNVALIAR